MTRRLRYMKKCRKHLRKRYVNEYLATCTGRETETRTGGPEQTETKLKVGLLIKVYLKREAQSRVERIAGRVIGKGGVTRDFFIQSPSTSKWKFTGKTRAVSGRLGSSR